MRKPDKAVKRRKQKKHIPPAKPKTPGQSWGKWVLLFGAIACLALIFGIYYFPKSGDKAIDEPRTPSLKRREPSTVQPKLTPQQETAVLKQEETELVQMVLKDFPDTEGALELAGNFHSRHGRRAEAADFWQRCLDKDPRRVSVYRSLATVAIDSSEFEEAIVHLRKVIVIHPEAPGIHEKTAHALVELGRFGEAIEELEKEIRISPQSPVAHFLLGEAYLKQKDHKKAQSHYEKALELSPGYANACYGLARTFSKLKQPAKAKEYYAKFAELRAEENQSVYKDRETIALADLASTRASTALALLNAEQLYRVRNDFARCEALLKRAAELDPENPKCFEKLGSLYNMTGRLPEALRQLERMSQIDPSNLYCYLNIGKISTKLKQYQRAERAYLNAISAAPNQSLGYQGLARLYLTTRDELARARQLAEKAVAMEQSAENFFILSWAFDVNGDRDQAAKAIKQALGLEPNNAKYRQINERIKNTNR